MSEIAEACQGKWKEILGALGVPSNLLSGKHGPCPFCGGKDRFRYTNKYNKGFYFCSGCGTGDGVQFVMKYKGVDFSAALELIRPIVGFVKSELSQEVLDKIADKKRRLEEAQSLWRKALPITRGCPAGLYLTRRTGILEYPSSLRFAPSLPYYDPDGEEVGRFPVMVAFVAGVTGKLINVHRTYLTPDGDKAALDPARKMSSGLGHPSGSAIRLWPVNGDGKLVVAEGIESAISAARVHNAPAWSLVCSDRMKSWAPPQGLKYVVVAGDNDLSYTGQAAAYCLANRLKVQFKTEKVEVSIPMIPGTDWNDVWVCNNS